MAAEQRPGGDRADVDTPRAQRSGAANYLDKLAASGGPFDPDVAATATFTAGGIGPVLAASAADRPADQVLPDLDRILVSCDGTTSPEGSVIRITPAALPGTSSMSRSRRGRT